MRVNKKNIYRLFLFLSAAAAAVLFIMSYIEGRKGWNTERIAEEAGQRIEKRIRHLEKYVDLSTETTDQHSCLEELPKDMVIYKYVNDSLISWSNQFPVLNDDISSKLVFQRLTSLRNRIISPLSNISQEYSYINLGPKWYVARSFTGSHNEKIIAGLEIKNTLIDGIRLYENGVNPLLEVPGQFSVVPLNYSGGSPVTVFGQPIFKVLADTTSSTVTSSSSLLKWLSLLFISITALIFLAGHRTIRAFVLSTLTLTIVFALSYLWGSAMSDNSYLFSPSTYADGPVLFSLGALLLLNLFIIMICACVYMTRETFLKIIQKNKTVRKRRLAIYSIALAVSALAILAYVHITLKSLLQNSNISLEFYRSTSDTLYSVIVYLSYIWLLICAMLLATMIAPAFRELTGHRIQLTSRKGFAIFALCAATYFSIITGLSGMQKEQKRVAVWANRLAVERDLGLEIRLKTIEDDIASDHIISSLIGLDGAERMIINRISENYLSRIKQNYSLNLFILGEGHPGLAKYYHDIASSGTPVYEGSRFVFISDGVGHSRYVGLFLYYSQATGLTRVFLEIEPLTNQENKGYSNILNQYSAPHGINIPGIYSYAKYAEGKLTSYKGNYPYPTIADKFSIGSSDPVRLMRFDDYTHFVHNISDTEAIVISRPKTSGMAFFISFSYLFLIIAAHLAILAHRRRKTKSNFFRTKINIILFVSSTMILTSMTVVSIFFVYKRNSENIHNMMSSKITTIQALINRHARNAAYHTDLVSPGFRTILEDISQTTKSDISLFSPAGKVFYSSTPEVFDKMILGTRMDRTAFHNIRHLHQRFHINSEQVDGYKYWSLYAPIINSNGDIIAIAGIPYTYGDHDFQREAFFHAALLINIFLLLLIISLLFSTREVNEIFSPLMEMGKKMNRTDIHNLEPIRYHREDEISSLVEAYNRMVKELSDSTIRLAQAERDKAWSQMARQVAHEIKNPLTPIKLEIQRLIRLKQNGNPKWEEKFDQVSSVVLEHIDILTETANEFSIFAKLYSEEPVLMDLDKTLRDQILIFDNKENISIEYIGLKDAIVLAPRPQLIRVFVNLIANAIQAVEIIQKEKLENDGTVYHGKVFIALRNSTLDNFYDIVVDDNGHGVKDENLGKLFTPNFTTKSGGTGLGLAICRNIIEKCDGKITYSKSFTLGGASFTVSLPKKSI